MGSINWKDWRNDFNFEKIGALVTREGVMGVGIGIRVEVLEGEEWGYTDERELGIKFFEVSEVRGTGGGMSDMVWFKG